MECGGDYVECDGHGVECDGHYVECDGLTSLFPGRLDALLPERLDALLGPRPVHGAKGRSGFRTSHGVHLLSNGDPLLPNRLHLLPNGAHLLPNRLHGTPHGFPCGGGHHDVDSDDVPAKGPPYASVGPVRNSRTLPLAPFRLTPFTQSPIS